MKSGDGSNCAAVSERDLDPRAYSDFGCQVFGQLVVEFFVGRVLDENLGKTVWAIGGFGDTEP